MLREVNYVSELMQGDIVLYMEEHFGFVEEIKEVLSEQYDDEGNEWTEPELIAVVKWFDGHRESVWTDTDVWNETKVLR
jgi:hypothetical protein